MSESICITLHGNYPILEWVNPVQINVLKAYFNVEQKESILWYSIIIHEGI
jgi:hypothetical protein